MPEVLDIEQAAFEFPWDEDGFMHYLRNRNCIGMVAEQGNRVIGYMVYELHKTRLHILNFAVAPHRQREGVGSELVRKLMGKLSAERRNRLTLEVRETNLDAQLFFHSHGFKAVSVLRDYYDDSPEDAYLFRFDHAPAEVLA